MRLISTHMKKLIDFISILYIDLLHAFLHKDKKTAYDKKTDDFLSPFL